MERIKRAIRTMAHPRRLARRKYRELNKWSAEVRKGTLYEKDLPDLCACLTAEEAFGPGFICGTSVTAEDLWDRNLMHLIRKHFNAVTLENELKPTAVMGWYPVQCPKNRLRTIEWEGGSLLAPELNHTQAELILNKLLKWNRRHPGKKFRVRGHVLVWHAQTPEWFFHEEYDKRRPYVSREEMDRRLKWYIHEMISHYNAPESPYYGLFYGWDVVNEAASNSEGIWRRDTEPGPDRITDDIHSGKSSWWAVYGSEEYVINAFHYANQYAPSDVKLYYNDYSEWNERKAQRILTVLRTIREKAGPPCGGTRIDGLGMQGHYRTDRPDMDTLRERILLYAQETGSLMLTELDVKADPSFDGSKRSRDAEYERQAAYYASLKNMLLELKQKEGVPFEGITIWGVIDSRSWLQYKNEVGGGSEGTAVQCPLLFDENYKAKPAFRAMAGIKHS